MDVIAQNWQRVEDRISRAASRCGRDPETITVVAVSKTRTPTEMVAALRFGLTNLGENRVQEAEAKAPHVGGSVRWHLIGKLQRNKARKAAALFDVIQSMDSLRLATALNRHAGDLGCRLEVLLQVNTSGAVEQGGTAPADVAELATAVARMEHLNLKGLMTIGTHVDDENAVRSSFQHLRQLFEDLGRDGHDMDWLSMGMSGDFEVAISEGANLLRLGTSIFGPRTN